MATPATAHGSTLAESTIPLVPPKVRGRIYARLPRLWIGFATATVCLGCQFLVAAPLNGSLALVFGLIGSCYWIFCVHRIHKVLADYTRCTYSISPLKAVLLQFVPIYEYFWFFRWTRQLGNFVEAENGEFRMRKVWPGLVLTAASIAGWLPPLKSFRLFLIFGVGFYFTRKLREVLPKSEPLPVPRLQQWKLSMSAGVGAAFSFIIFQAGQHFYSEQRTEKLHELAAIFLVSIAVLIFLEPVFESLRGMLRTSEKNPEMSEQHSALQRRPLQLRLAFFLILVLTSLLHGLLHWEIENAIKSDLTATLSMLLSTLVVAGGITYFWIGAAHRHPSHAARSGLLSGAVLGFLVAFTVLAIVSPATADSQAQSTNRVMHYFPLVPSPIIQDISRGIRGNSGLKEIGIIALPWALLGLLGGISIDRRWPSCKASGVACTIMFAALISGLSFLMWRRLVPGLEMLWHLSAVFGWGLALIVCSSSRILMPQTQTSEP